MVIVSNNVMVSSSLLLWIVCINFLYVSTEEEIAAFLKNEESTFNDYKCHGHSCVSKLYRRDVDPTLSSTTTTTQAPTMTSAAAIIPISSTTPAPAATTTTVQPPLPMFNNANKGSSTSPPSQPYYGFPYNQSPYNQSHFTVPISPPPSSSSQPSSPAYSNYQLFPSAPPNMYNSTLPSSSSSSSLSLSQPQPGYSWLPPQQFPSPPPPPPYEFDPIKRLTGFFPPRDRAFSYSDSFAFPAPASYDYSPHRPYVQTSEVIKDIMDILQGFNRLSERSRHLTGKHIQQIQETIMQMHHNKMSLINEALNYMIRFLKVSNNQLSYGGGNSNSNNHNDGHMFMEDQRPIGMPPHMFHGSRRHVRDVGSGTATGTTTTTTTKKKKLITPVITLESTDEDNEDLKNTMTNSTSQLAAKLDSMSKNVDASLNNKLHGTASNISRKLEEHMSSFNELNSNFTRLLKESHDKLHAGIRNDNHNLTQTMVNEFKLMRQHMENITAKLLTLGSCCEQKSHHLEQQHQNNKVLRDRDINENITVRVEVPDEENPAIGRLLKLNPMIAARKLRHLWNTMNGKGMVAICYHNQPTSFSSEHPLAENDTLEVRKVFNGTMDSMNNVNGLNLDLPNYINSVLMEVRNLRRNFVSLCIETPDKNVEYFHDAACMNLMVSREKNNPSAP